MTCPGEPNGLAIDYLADHPEVLGQLAAGFKTQWATHFADQPVDAIKVGFADSCRDEGLPIALVAMVEDRFAGTASLRKESGSVGAGLTPWLTHLYVDPSMRGQGIGVSLIRAIESQARRHGYAELHAATSRAAAVFERCGWKVMDQVEHQGTAVTILHCRLDPTPPPAQ